MAYTKTVWTDRDVEYPNRYKDQNGNQLILTRDEGVVTEAGTLLNSTVMNNIEDGIEALEDGIEALDTRVDAVETTVSEEKSGWMKAEETWAYASSNTITVPAGGLLKYAKGDKIKLTQGTVKYFYIIKVADTLLTITGGSTYTLTSATITDNYYSHTDSPLGFPSYFSHTPSYIGFSSNPNIHMQFKIIGSTCFIHGYASGAGVSNSNQFKISLPVAPINISAVRTYCIGYGTDNGAMTQATFIVSGAEDANNLIVCKGITENASSWTTSGSKYCNPPTIMYEF